MDFSEMSPARESAIPQPAAPAGSAPAWDETAACETCGEFGAYRWEGATLCLGCYAQRGACCAEREENDCPRPRPADGPERS